METLFLFYNNFMQTTAIIGIFHVCQIEHMISTISKNSINHFSLNHTTFSLNHTTLKSLFIGSLCVFMT